MENFQGQDGFVWFTGVVEDRNDPTKLTKCSCSLRRLSYRR